MVILSPHDALVPTSSLSPLAGEGAEQCEAGEGRFRIARALSRPILTSFGSSTLSRKRERGKESETTRVDIPPTLAEWSASNKVLAFEFPQDHRASAREAVAAADAAVPHRDLCGRARRLQGAPRRRRLDLRTGLPAGAAQARHAEGCARVRVVRGAGLHRLLAAGARAVRDALPRGREPGSGRGVPTNRRATTSSTAASRSITRTISPTFRRPSSGISW